MAIDPAPRKAGILNGPAVDVGNGGSSSDPDAIIVEKKGGMRNMVLVGIAILTLFLVFRPR